MTEYFIKYHEKRKWYGVKVRGFGVFKIVNGKEKLVSDLSETPHEARAFMQSIGTGKN